jgi:hypothetical protein
VRRRRAAASSIEGSGFGVTTAESQVVIGGLRAIVTRRNDREIHATCPRACGPGRMRYASGGRMARAMRSRCRSRRVRRTVA